VLDHYAERNRTVFEVAGAAITVQEINIKLWRNDDAQDWSVEINGLRHEHITSRIMEDLVECALIVAERTLTEASTRRML
jgi:hypothetical protein